MDKNTAEQPAEPTVDIQLLGSSHGAEKNAVRSVTREKADRLIANGLAVEVDPTEHVEEIQGELVESDTAGTGPAVNAETGEVTQPGEPLPVIEQAVGEPIPPLEEPQSEELGASTGKGRAR